MHGNTPYAGPAGDPDSDPAPADVETLRTEVAALTARTRALLPDEFAVGSELRSGTDSPHARVAVQPPIGNVVSTGIDVGASEEKRDELAVELAASAAVQVKRALDDVAPTAG
jgi:hypothetical protein